MVIPCIRLLRRLAHDLPKGVQAFGGPHETKAVRLALAMGEVVQRAGSAFFFCAEPFGGNPSGPLHINSRLLHISLTAA
jgi:hypothetical protein